MFQKHPLFLFHWKNISVLRKVTGNMKSPCAWEELQYLRTLSPKTEHPCHCRRATAFWSSRSEGSSRCILPAWGCAHSYPFLCFLCLPTPFSRPSLSFQASGHGRHCFSFWLYQSDTPVSWLVASSAYRPPNSAHIGLRAIYKSGCNYHSFFGGKDSKVTL